MQISDLTVYVVFTIPCFYHSYVLSMHFPPLVFNHFPSIKTVCFQFLAPFLHRFFKLLFKIVFYFSFSTKSLEVFVPVYFLPNQKIAREAFFGWKWRWFSYHPIFFQPSHGEEESRVLKPSQSNYPLSSILKLPFVVIWQVYYDRFLGLAWEALLGLK